MRSTGTAYTIRLDLITIVILDDETWSLTVREEHRLSVFENRMPRRIFLPKRDEITGG
jgi:hypothetical protein